MQSPTDNRNTLVENARGRTVRQMLGSGRTVIVVAFVVDDAATCAGRCAPETMPRKHGLARGRREQREPTQRGTIFAPYATRES